MPDMPGKGLPIDLKPGGHLILAGSGIVLSVEPGGKPVRLRLKAIAPDREAWLNDHAAGVWYATTRVKGCE